MAPKHRRGALKRSRVVKRSLRIDGSKTSVTLEDAFWNALKEIAAARNIRVSELISTIKIERQRGSNLSALAAELVSLAPDVIAATSSPATAALQRATSSIPIVMAAINDPIGLGFVKSLAKPGGNITGLSNLSADFTAKSFELLHVAVPNAKRIAVLTSPNPLHEAVVKEAYSVAGAMGLTIIPVMARTPADLNDAFTAMHKETCDAVVVLSDPRTSRKIVELANEGRLPAIYQNSSFADMGGLLTYSANFPEMFRRAAVYVDKILRGASPADLPVEQPTRLELQVNLKTAKALGLTIPDSILVRADRVIE